jgi:hypothetical protein
MFIPTAEIIMEEKRSCQPSRENNYKCDALYVKEGDDGTYYMNETRVKYIANVEDYVIQFTSTYHRDALSGTSLKHASAYMECQDKPETGVKKWGQRAGEVPLWERCKDLQLKEIDCLPGAKCSKDDLKKNPFVLLQEDKDDTPD